MHRMHQHKGHQRRADDVGNKSLGQPGLHLRFGDAGELTPGWTEQGRRVPERANRLLDDHRRQDREPIDRKFLHDALPMYFLPERSCAAASNTGQAIIIRAHVREPNLDSTWSLSASARVDGFAR
jgi:hypothetical protein